MATWNCRVTYPAVGLTDEQIEAGADAVDGRVTYYGDEGRITFIVEIERPALAAAVTASIAQTRDAALAANALATPVAIEVEPWADVADRVQVAPFGVVGMVEVAEILGVSRQRAHELTHDPDFPAPLDLAAGSVYNKAGVERFAATRNRTRGRPRRAT